VTLDKYDIVTETGTSTYYNWLQCFDPPDLGSELEAAGLEIQELLGDVAGATYDALAPEFAVVACRS